MASSKRKLLQPFRFRSSEEDNKRQYDALFGTPIVPLRPISVPNSTTPPLAQQSVDVLETPPGGEEKTSTVGVCLAPSVDVSFETPLENDETPTVGVYQSIEPREDSDIQAAIARKPVQREKGSVLANNELQTPTVGVLKSEPILFPETKQTPTVGESQRSTAGIWPMIGIPVDGSKLSHPAEQIGQSLPLTSYENGLSRNQENQTPFVGTWSVGGPAIIPVSQESNDSQTFPSGLHPVDVSITPTVQVFKSPGKQGHQAVHPPCVDSFAWFQSWDEKQIFDARGVRRISIVQDILSNVEFGYYRKLWEANSGDFRVISKDENVKVFQAGYATLAKLLNMDRRSVARYIVDAFSAKQILEVAEESQSASRTCTVYRLYSFREILARLRNAGYTYAKKHGKAVYLVKPFKGNSFDAPPVGVLQTSPVDVFAASTGDVYDSPTEGLIKTPTVGKTSTVGGTPTGSIGETPTGAVDVLAPSSLSRFYKENSFSKSVVEDLEKLILDSPFRNFDRNAMTAIVKQSLDCVSDITAEEIFDLFQEKAKAVAGNRRIENFTGMMIWAWPGYFTAARVQAYREAVTKQREQERNAQQENIAMWREWLTNPQIPEEWKQVARDGLLAEGVGTN